VTPLAIKGSVGLCGREPECLQLMRPSLDGRHPPGDELIRILGAVMAGSAVTGVGLSLIGLLVLKPHGSGFGYYATVLLTCAVNLGAAALIWRFIVRRRRPGASQ
jgi:hypothetical protein